MSVSVEQRRTRPAAEQSTPTPAPAEEPGLGDRGWVLCLGVLVATVLVFTAMIAITALAGGDGFPS
ncbi:hypothetical protein O2W15_02010 [Modestobacter sp. VKM Ac-2979]|uniref:hypothetical protein n=1 Tax=unclassified Modestobacter TaxID=2643866 RepID=UPI0022AB5D95|nr:MULTISPECIES: hypothetical protein [unclassified Modestobacter]MCZ2810200.1 hypothetical protein [Modestobacter sp. VKM Ac-2979]MCZ2841686.1 hypothetical protein [Modestobacter sp. VKM Ac-2980]